MGFAVLANISCGISVILILNCDIAVFFKPAGCVFLAFWSTIVVSKRIPHLFLTIFSRFWSFRKQPISSHILIYNLTVLTTGLKPFHCFHGLTARFCLYFCPHVNESASQLYRLTMKLRYFPDFFAILLYLPNFQQPPMFPSKVKIVAVSLSYAFHMITDQAMITSLSATTSFVRVFVQFLGDKFVCFSQLVI